MNIRQYMYAFFNRFRAKDRRASADLNQVRAMCGELFDVLGNKVAHDSARNLKISFLLLMKKP